MDSRGKFQQDILQKREKKNLAGAVRGRGVTTCIWVKSDWGIEKHTQLVFNSYINLFIGSCLMVLLLVFLKGIFSDSNNIFL